jgi:uncharacterized protein YbcV (DUF1398 family)
MFTIDEIKTAHSKVKSGADFPAYIQEIKKFGVIYYEAFVADGQINYYDTTNFSVNVPAKHEKLTIAEACKEEEFKIELLAHQLGKTDFLTFIKMCARCGIEKWEIWMEKMTCTYFDKSGKIVLEENIPG